MTTDSPQHDDGLVVSVTDGVVSVSGEIDADSAPRLEQALAPFTHAVTLDMSGVEFIDSSGLRVLIRTEKRLAETDAHLTILAPSPQVERVLQLAALDTYLTIER